MATSTATAQPAALGFDRRAFLIAAAVSVISTVIPFAFLALAGVAAVAGLAAATRGSRRAETLLGVGGGLVVGEVLYLALPSS